jgi:hypothetical protein
MENSEEPLVPPGTLGPCVRCGELAPYRRNPYTWELYEEPNWNFRCDEIVEELSWEI